ncbi:nitrous oxide reductase accessory protein NosL [Halarcobacter ebronensis]|uniref:NosL family protein n=1 Tax=Halarcobacter ebronensis TaxID=1462615 RepID=A0A4Q1ASD8_9BACT|nr:nitrous oxide reductase accessory protein NosL [Halarcobacter ebronensis]QKF82577.1 NosL domain-containing protein [Halarcobacter ebronensis]RXK07411.1 hypothetical protein CRV07_02805 [Halarcobacter ebronensis]
MRRVWPYLFLVALSLTLYNYSKETREDIKVVHGYYGEGPYRIVLETYKNRYICNDCGMMIKSYQNSAQVISSTGDVYVFDDVGCMLRWLNRQDFKNEVRIYVFTTDTGAYIDANLAWYVRDANTPIGYGFGAYETSIGAITSGKTRSSIESQVGTFEIKRENKQIYSFDEIKLYANRGETLLNPMIKRELLKKE